MGVTVVGAYLQLPPPEEWAGMYMSHCTALPELRRTVPVSLLYSTTCVGVVGRVGEGGWEGGWGRG